MHSARGCVRRRPEILVAAYFRLDMHPAVRTCILLVHVHVPVQAARTERVPTGEEQRGSVLWGNHELVADGAGVVFYLSGKNSLHPELLSGA